MCSISRKRWSSALRQYLRVASATGAALMSLAAARKRLASITELDCLSFVRAWRADVATWRERLALLPVLADLVDAAKYLDLPALR